MKLYITAEEIATIESMSLDEARKFAFSILDNHSDHAKAVKKNDGQKLVRLRQNIMSKKTSAQIMKMFYDMYLAGEGMGTVGSKWKNHYAKFA